MSLLQVVPPSSVQRKTPYAPPEPSKKPEMMTFFAVIAATP